MLQTKILTVRSNYSIPIELLSVSSPDSRVDARILNREIKPWNMSITGMISFDAGKTGMEAQSEFIKAISQFSIENPPTLQIDAFNLQKAQGKKNFKFGTHATSGGDIFNKFQSLSDKEVLQMIKSLEPHLIDEDGSKDVQSLINLSVKDDAELRDPNLPNKKQSLINVPVRDLFKQSITGGAQGQAQGLGTSRGSEHRLNTGVFAPPEKDFKVNESLNYRDILAWRDREDEWKTYERRHKTTINTSLEITTSLLEKVEIPIETSLKKPQISTEKSLDFGALQVGSRATKDVILTNPTSETVQVQLFVSYDLDKSFISKQTDKQAWLDKGAFRDKMLRQIDLHMRGVDLEYVA